MTVDQLKNFLFERGIRKNAISFWKGVLTASEQYCIAHEDGVWEVYYFERGNKNGLHCFEREDSACAYLLSVLEKDKTVWIKL